MTKPLKWSDAQAAYMLRHWPAGTDRGVMLRAINAIPGGVRATAKAMKQKAQRMGLTKREEPDEPTPPPVYERFSDDLEWKAACDDAELWFEDDPNVPEDADLENINAPPVPMKYKIAIREAREARIEALKAWMPTRGAYERMEAAE